MDEVIVKGLRARGRHGVLPEEKENDQEFIVDILLECDTRPAAAGDDLSLTVDYAALSEAAADIVEGTSFDLIETLAERIAAEALSSVRARRVTVTVRKPDAPLDVSVDWVGVTITRESGETP
jgi:7,8-dihydroneopterin aldolase/epimerase/oxygenase